MNSLFLLNHPGVFQGERKLLHSTNYFEGWYFKCTNGKDTISFIPGIHIENNKKSAFLQIITKETSYFIPYSFEEFTFTYEPFSIAIGNNTFSLTSIHLSIATADVSLTGSLAFSHSLSLEKKFLSPNIMGPFSFLPFMECNHAILSMKNTINGFLQLNKTSYTFKKGAGYIEKDWGCSFPKTYEWLQGNCFQHTDASFFFSIADIPFKSFRFDGFICVLTVAGKEYRFTTYNGAHLEKINPYFFILRKNRLKLEIRVEGNHFFALQAPKNGSMEQTIKESVDSNIHLQLYRNNTLLMDDFSTNCGLEIV